MATSKTHEDDDDFIEDNEIWSDADVDFDDSDDDKQLASNSQQRARDWRDLERYKEELELQRLMRDDYLFDEDKHSRRH